MPLLGYKMRLQLVGVMPQRALLRLRRAGIPLFFVTKTDEKTLHFCVWKKDVEKVFAIYPKAGYDISEYISEYSPYTVTELGAVGFGRIVEKAQKRIGFVLGILLFCAATAYADDYAFGVEFTSSSVYAREAYLAMEECGIALWEKYDDKNADAFCAKMLALKGVEFCSIKKTGLKLYVDVRLTPIQTQYFQKGVMQAKHTGELTALTVLRGSALKKIGDTVQAGETLVGDWYSTEDGGQVRVELIARARIACTYEAEIAANTEEEAFALAYLDAGLQNAEACKKKKIEKTDGGFLVRIDYDAVESMNF